MYSPAGLFVTHRAIPETERLPWTPVVHLSSVDQADFGRRPLVATHNLHQSELFTDAALIDLLDHFPRENLYALTMGTDPARTENRLALHDGVSGAELLRAVKNGRLWLNVTQVDRADRRYRELIDQLYAQLTTQVPGFSPDFSQGTLLISSPHALVYYHADGPASVLWHIRGRKRVWVYPALDERYMQREALEDIFAGVRHEYLPYEHIYDQGAVVYDLEPGQWAAWPQNAPHRVTNLDSVNVSLSTEYFTRQSRWRARVYVANRFFRARLGLHGLSAREAGLAAVGKTVVHRLVRKAGLDRLPAKHHTPSMRVDPDAPGGVVALEENGSTKRCNCEVRCFGSLEEAAFLRDEVNALNRASTRPDPFSTFEFLENYLRNDGCFPGGQGARLWFLAAFFDGRLIGYVVLRQVTHKILGLRTYKLGFLVTHDTDRPHLVARSEHVSQVSEAFYVYLLGRKQEWSFLEFQQQNDASALFPPPATVDLKGYLVRQWPSLENGTIHIRWGTLREYFKALSKKFRSNVSRQMRGLLAAGDVELLASSDPTIVPALFELYRGIELHSWMSQTNANIGRHPERVEYFKGLLDARQPMRVSIQILLVDGIPVAGLINGAFMKGLYALHIVYDDRLSRFAPGSAILLMGMRQAIDGRYAFFNLLSGFGYYKVRWLAEITESRSAQIYRVGSLSFWHRKFGDGRRRVFSSMLKKTPVLFNPVRRDVSEREDEQAEPGETPKLQLNPEERARIAALIAEVRKGQGEFLSKTELAAVMPFETQRVSEVKCKRGP
ncbi:MAG: GNAT family N-acetyltransferase [Sulfuricaulis sp.]